MTDDESPDWDPDFAAELVGATVIVGLTHREPEGERLEQMFGTVVSTEAGQGVALLLEGGRAGEIYWLPPSTDNFVPARPGEYRLKSTGEVVTDPDYTSSWTIEPPTE